MMKNYTMHDYPPVLLFAWVARFLTYSIVLAVPSEFWVQVLALLDVPQPIKVVGSPFVGSSCWTIVEVIETAVKMEALRRAGSLDSTYHDPTAKYWPLKIFVGSMFGLICMSLIAPGIIAIIPKATEVSIGFIGGAVGYWFMSKRLPKILAKKEDEEP